MQATSWADRLELVGDDERLVGFARGVAVAAAGRANRALVERTELRTGLSAAMRRAGFFPVDDRGQLLVDLAVAQVRAR